MRIEYGDFWLYSRIPNGPRNISVCRFHLGASKFWEQYCLQFCIVQVDKAPTIDWASVRYNWLSLSHACVLSRRI